jgi:hypothetical protein
MTNEQIIELYNSSVNANETNIKYPLKSLSNKKLSRIIGEICELLKSQGAEPDRENYAVLSKGQGSLVSKVASRLAPR